MFDANTGALDRELVTFYSAEWWITRVLEQQSCVEVVPDSRSCGCRELTGRLFLSLSRVTTGGKMRQGVHRQSGGVHTRNHH